MVHLIAKETELSRNQSPSDYFCKPWLCGPCGAVYVGVMELIVTVALKAAFLYSSLVLMFP